MSMKLDGKDRAILRVLQERSKVSISEISSAVGLSHTPTWKRVKRLHALEVITGQVSLLDPVKVGLPITVFAQVSVHSLDEEDTLEQFDAAIQEIDYIVECYSVTGERDFILKVVIETVDSYERLLKTTLIHLPGVFSIESIISLSRGKYTTELPL
jgi:Lrp/AsnC family transcriptional regulator